MEQVIGKIKVKVDGEVAVVDVTSEGYIVLSDGRKELLSEEQFRAVREALNPNKEATVKDEEKDDDKSSKKKSEKPKSGSNVAVWVLSALLAAVLAAGIGGIYSGVLSVNTDNHSGTVYPQGDKTDIPNVDVEDLSDADTDKVERAILIARVVTKEGQVKEIILGQIQNQENKIDMTPSPGMTLEQLPDNSDPAAPVEDATLDTEGGE